MRRSTLDWGIAFFCLAIASPTILADSQLTGPEKKPSVTSLIAALNDPDPTTRSIATRRLIDMEDAAEAELCKAIATAPPEAASRIAFVLMHIRWTTNDDSVAVRQRFDGYAESDPETRRALIDENLVNAPPPAKTALLRIVEHDVCATVRWDAALALVRSMDDKVDPVGQQLEPIISGHAIETISNYPPPVENAALLAVAGWACRDTNADRAAELMDRAVAIEADKPSAYAGQMDFVFQWLVDRATTSRKYDRVADLLRNQSDHWPWIEQAVAEPVANLFALHADFGPFPGFDDDVKNYRGYFIRPEMMYCLGRWLNRKHHPLLGATADAAALLAGGISAQSHYSAGVFLAQHEWNAPAERELNLCLMLPGGNSWETYYELSRNATARGDDFAAGRDLEMAIKKLPANGNTSEQTANDLWVQVEWHYLRAARDIHDDAAAKMRLNKLLEYEQIAHALQRDPAMAADIVPELQDLGRKAEADRIFVDAYNALAAEVAAAPSQPMPKNNLAWLCACSGRHLDEAIRIATEAVALVPHDGECIDTLAEAYFRSGNLAHALELEKQAVEQKPDDIYMQKQVKKYEAALAGK
jgi:tetratricopeptide (TPR) repeat protein